MSLEFYKSGTEVLRKYKDTYVVDCASYDESVVGDFTFIVKNNEYYVKQNDDIIIRKTIVNPNDEFILRVKYDSGSTVIINPTKE